MSKSLPLTLALALILPLGLTATLAAEPAPYAAPALVTKNCMQCHGAEIYTRKDRKVSSLDGLARQVRSCEIGLELRWFDEDIQAVTDHLNDQFYHFKP